MRFIILALFMFSFISWGNAATLQGSVVSWQTLTPLTAVVIDINSVPHQRLVSQEGFYLVDLEPGSYQIQAVYYSNASASLYALEEIKIRGEGQFTYDLILFPISEADLNRLDLLGGMEEEIPKNQPDFLPYFIFIIVIVVMAGILYYFRYFRSKKESISVSTPPSESPKKPDDSPSLDKHAQEVVDALKRCGNRLTQKELREKVTFGEAKTSLVVAELEEAGIVKKIKQGRGNIIVLKKL